MRMSLKNGCIKRSTIADVSLISKAIVFLLFEKVVVVKNIVAFASNFVEFFVERKQPS